MLRDQAERSVCPETVAGWLWYCDEHDTHGNGDTSDEVEAAAAVGHPDCEIFVWRRPPPATGPHLRVVGGDAAAARHDRLVSGWRAEWERLLPTTNRGVRYVAALHTGTDDGYCAACTGLGDAAYETWPCETVTVMAAGLGCPVPPDDAAGR